MPSTEASTQPESVEEDDDYLNMSFEEPSSSKIETSIQRAARLKHEGLERGRVKSKEERQADAQAAREAALATSSLDQSNKGFKLMQKLGFAGGALGKAGDDVDRRTEPIHLSMKEDRGGIGMDSEKKRKFREEAEKLEHSVKRTKAEEGEYRDRLVHQRAVKRMEGQIIGAMSVAEKLDDEDFVSTENGTEVKKLDHAATRDEDSRLTHKPRTKLLIGVNVLWRSLVRRRIEKERDRRMRHDLHQSLSQLPTYNDPEEDMQDRQAFGTEEEELEQEDPELDQFLSEEPEVRLARLVSYLRERWHYCFWCKFRYADNDMEDCPGLTEDDHS